mmetsp:Transcript_34711/g.55840  ORF Transcript_34711/g.55840 Transcript_34711/m.55840 type:complete len:193 (-) Transcript_34711:105-683(-)
MQVSVAITDIYLSESLPLDSIVVVGSTRSSGVIHGKNDVWKIVAENDATGIVVSKPIWRRIQKCDKAAMEVDEEKDNEVLLQQRTTFESWCEQVLLQQQSLSSPSSSLSPASMEGEDCGRLPVCIWDDSRNIDLDFIQNCVTELHSWEHLSEIELNLPDSRSCITDWDQFQAALILQAFIDKELGGWANTFG